MSLGSLFELLATGGKANVRYLPEGDFESVGGLEISGVSPEVATHGPTSILVFDSGHFVGLAIVGISAEFSLFLSTCALACHYLIQAPMSDSQFDRLRIDIILS